MIKLPYLDSIKNRQLVLGTIFTLGLVLRLNAAIHDHTLPEKDAYEYDQIALHLVKGEGFRNETGELTAFRPPFYPFFLAAIYKLGGHDYQLVRIIQAVLSAATVLVIAGLGCVIFGPQTGYLAGFIAAIYPPFYAFYFSSSALIAETVYIFIFTLALLTLYFYFSKPSWKIAMLSGLFWGMAILARPIPQFLLLILPIVFLVMGYPKRHISRYFILATGVSALCLVPWVIRNYFVFNEFVPFSTNGGFVFYESNHPGSDGFGTDFRRNVMMLEVEKLKAQGVNEAERSRIFFSRGMKFILQNPYEALKLFVWKAFLYMDLYHTLEEKNERSRIINWAYVIVLVGAVLGFVWGASSQQHRRYVLSLLLIFIYFILFHALCHTAHRYRLPSEPILIIMTAFMLDHLGRRLGADFKERTRR